jgi:hypothetical protein
MAKRYKPMHPRKRLLKVIRQTSQVITDIESWNDNRPDAPPIDCEADRVMLAKARAALAAWDSGKGRAIDAAFGELLRSAEVIEAEMEQDR